MSTARTWVASIPFSSRRSIGGRLSVWGGTLVLTDEGLTFTPLSGIGPNRRLALGDIRSVDVFDERPPRLRLITTDGRSLVFMILPRRTTSSWSRDSATRDEAVAAINDRLAQVQRD